MSSRLTITIAYQLRGTAEPFSHTNLNEVVKYHDHNGRCWNSFWVVITLQSFKGVEIIEREEPMPDVVNKDVRQIYQLDE
jgi:hypothetical protein